LPLNPLMKIKEQIGEALLYHGKAEKEEIDEKVVELLKLAEVPEPEERMNTYPHHLSGGLKQRVAIAMALACNPDYILADEPTTALDVTVQSKILDLLKNLSVEKNTGILLITHDMGVVAEFSQRVFVMYAGYAVESGRTEEIFEKPLHPYTKGLIECSPVLKGGEKRKLFSIPFGFSIMPISGYSTHLIRNGLSGLGKPIKNGGLAHIWSADYGNNIIHNQNFLVVYHHFANSF